mgnify:CR=1 FL=1
MASGKIVTPDSGVPALSDIALALGRQPRFGGQCREHWTVLQHSLVVADLIKEYPISFDSVRESALFLGALLHDSHEYIGDIPRPFKTADIKKLQGELDRRLLKYIGWTLACWEYRIDSSKICDVVKAADSLACVYEAAMVGPVHYRRVKEWRLSKGELFKANAAIEWYRGKPDDTAPGGFLYKTFVTRVCGALEALRIGKKWSMQSTHTG